MKKLVLTEHAEKRLLERGFSEELVKQIIRNPDFKLDRGKKKESIKFVGGKRRKVIYEEEENYIKVITIH